MGRPDVIGSLKRFASEWGIEANRSGDTLVLRWQGIASLTIELTDNGTAMVAIWIRTLSTDWPGERSDLNELASLVYALTLEGSGINCHHSVVPHPAAYLPGEVYATYLVPEQPHATGLPVDESGQRVLERLIVAASMSLRWFVCLLEIAGWGGPTNEGFATQSLAGDDETWIDRALSALGGERTNSTYDVRSNPSWRYLRTEEGASVFECEELTRALRIRFAQSGAAHPAIAEGPPL